MTAPLPRTESRAAGRQQAQQVSFNRNQARTRNPWRPGRDTYDSRPGGNAPMLITGMTQARHLLFGVLQVDSPRGCRSE